MCLLSEILAHNICRKKCRHLKKSCGCPVWIRDGKCVECVDVNVCMHVCVGVAACTCMCACVHVCMLVALWEGQGASAAVKCATAIYRPSWLQIYSLGRQCVCMCVCLRGCMCVYVCHGEVQVMKNTLWEEQLSVRRYLSVNFLWGRDRTEGWDEMSLAKKDGC